MCILNSVSLIFTRYWTMPGTCLQRVESVSDDKTINVHNNSTAKERDSISRPAPRSPYTLSRRTIYQILDFRHTRRLFIQDPFVPTMVRARPFRISMFMNIYTTESCCDSDHVHLRTFHITCFRDSSPTSQIGRLSRHTWF